jgi:predicted membrane chloride channel (bestrophin family)
MDEPVIGMPTSLTRILYSLPALTVFKTNTSFKRWDEARKAWGVIVNNSRSVARQTSTWIQKTDLPKEEKVRLLRRIATAVWLFPRTMQTHLLNPAEDAVAYAAEIRDKLPNKELAEMLVAARHKPTLALYEMSCAINELPLDTFQRTTIDSDVSQMCDAMGGCDRIFGSPVPVSYTRFAARFVELWMLFVPFALYQVSIAELYEWRRARSSVYLIIIILRSRRAFSTKPYYTTWNHWAAIPSSMLLGFFFLGIEDLAIGLEEPFSVLPLDKIAFGIGLSAEEHVEWMESELSVETFER